MSRIYHTIICKDDYGNTYKLHQRSCATTDYNEFYEENSEGLLSPLFSGSDEMLDNLSKLMDSSDFPSNNESIKKVNEFRKFNSQKSLRGELNETLDVGWLQALIRKYEKALNLQAVIKKETPFSQPQSHILIDQNTAIFNTILNDLKSLF